MGVECSRCGETYHGESEMGEEIWFSGHVCKGMRPLDELSTDLLEEVASKRMTEAEVWAEQGRRDKVG